MAGDRVSVVAQKQGDPADSAINNNQSSLPTETTDAYNKVIEEQIGIKNAVDNPAIQKDLIGDKLILKKSDENPDISLTDYLKNGVVLGDQNSADGANTNGNGQPPVNYGTLLDNLPPELKQYADEVRTDVKNDKLNYFDENVTAVAYNKNGTINSVTLQDGTIVSYSYERDKDGGMVSCSLEASGITIIFKLTKSGDIHISDEPIYNGKGTTIEIYLTDSGAGKTQSSIAAPHGLAPPMEPHMTIKPALIYSGKTDISPEEIARTPVKFDFKSIKAAVSQAEGIKEGALKNYEKNSAGYYNEIEKSLIKNGLLSKDENKFSGRIKREAIDKAVADVYSVSKGKGAVGALHGLIAKEKILRGKILIPALVEYDSKVKEARDDINNMIDKLINLFGSIIPNL